MCTLNTATMLVYHKYRLQTQHNEIEIQREKSFCDGTMQAYLQNAWKHESIILQTQLYITD